MKSLKSYSLITMDQEYTLKSDYPRYCLHCHVNIENDQHLEAHAGHDIFSLKDAETKLKSNLNLTISTIEAKRTYMAQLQDSIEEFDERYDRCKEAVHATAKELCSKIMDHEKRLIEELDMHREIEHRKIGIFGPGGIQPLQQKLDSLSRTCQTLLKESAQDNFLEHFKQSRENINLTMLDLSAANLDPKAIQSTAIDFASIRCNTAFGTISVAKPKPLRRRVSLKLTEPLPFSQLMIPTSDRLERVSPKWSSEAEDSNGKKANTINKGAKYLQRKLSLQQFHLTTKNSFFFKDADRKSPSPELRISPLPVVFALDPCKEEFDEHLELLWIKDSEGPGPGQINCPTDVAFLPDNTLVVCDRGNMRLQLFNTEGESVKIIGENKIKPYRVNVTPGGQIILTDSKDSCVRVYDSKGHSVFTLGKKSLITSTSFKAPCAVAQNSKTQYIVSDLETNQVTSYGKDGKMTVQMDFKKPSYISTDKSGRILVSDNLDHCVKVYDSSFQYLFQCTLASHSDSHETDNYLTYPSGACFDDSGNIYVADWGSHTVTLFNSEGIFVKQLLSKQDGLYHPAGVAVKDGFLVVTNFSESHSSVMLYRLI